MKDALRKIMDLQKDVYGMCGLQIDNFCAEKESKEYSAHTFSLAGKHIRFRIAKKTPTKTGQFVTIWKRMPTGVIGPYDRSDLIDLLVINIIDENKVGQFVFPKSVLVEKDIFSENDKGGKRAIRTYSPWDEASNTQSEKTKKWQNKYFVEITPGIPVNIEKIKELYEISE